MSHRHHDHGALPPRNPLRGRFNSWLLARFENAFHKEIGDLKTRLFSGVNGLIVEIGAGNGINFRYYPDSAKVVAIEPNPYMHRRLARSAAAHNVDMELHTAVAETLAFEDGSVDVVVSTLVLCTVADPVQVITEAHRVLKPGGRLIFIEHVAAPAGTGLRTVQNVLHRPWRWLFEGCHTNRETGKLLRDSLFHEVEIEPFTSSVMPPPIVTQIAGLAIKRPADKPASS